MAKDEVRRDDLTYFRGWLRSQVIIKLPVPAKPFTGQTIIVTGSNSGLGLEAARHFVALDAEKVILAVRSREKGEAAVKSIEASTRRTGVAEVWDLDLSSYASVKAFAAKVTSDLPRLDVLVNNAGVVLYDFAMAEDNESTIIINVTSQLLLSLLLLPKLRETSVALRKEVVCTFTNSFVHFMANFPERKNEHIFREFPIKEKTDMGDRYFVSKMVQLLLIRELAGRVSDSSKEGDVVISAVNPGFVKTEVMRHAGTLFWIIFPIWRAMVARSGEEGSRTLVHAAYGGKETHGQYLSDCAVAP